MPQIAQQDYLFLHLQNGWAELTVEEKKQIQDLHKRGVLFDAIISDGATDFATQTRVIADQIEVDDRIVVWDTAEGTLTTVDVSIE